MQVEISVDGQSRTKKGDTTGKGIVKERGIHEMNDTR
jgi:hypothetical protein